MYSIRGHSHWNMLLHSEWVNLYVTASRVGSSFDGEPCLICLWLQRGLRHASCPCSALINGSGEREEGEKVCVRPCQRLWGFSQLNYIKRQSPTDTHIHTHTCLAIKYEYTHTYIHWVMCEYLWIFTQAHFLHTITHSGWYSLKYNSALMRWEAFLFRLQRKGWLAILPLSHHHHAQCGVCLLSNATLLSF